MQDKQFNKHFFSYLQSSPTPFHAVDNMGEYLLNHNYIKLAENENWQLNKGESYFITRDNGALIAFTLGEHESVAQGFRMLSAHTDSPCLQIKPQAELKEGAFLKLGVEVYGGCLLNTWFDRDLSLAGRVCCEMADSSLAILLIDFDRALLTIPSVAIHFDREANENKTVNRQHHLPPIIAQTPVGDLPDFRSILLDQLAIQYPDKQVEEILSFDLFCYDFQPPAYLGLKNELIGAARLDNLLSCFVGMKALVESGKASSRNNLFICTNHEENGSVSTSGASGTFVDSILDRIIPDPTIKRISLHNSFLISMDNSHCTHPNFKNKSDPAHDIILNKGPVIKINANQRYATDSRTSAIYKHICKQAEVKPQEFVMRSDMACGSTVGPMTAARLGVKTVDVGAPSLAMHSIRELTGGSDPRLLYQTIVSFLETDTFRMLS